jgi:polyisoprenyl-phosphate glycosyltransferase
MPTLSKNINGLKGPILVMGASGFVGANLFNTIKKYRDDIYAVVQHEKNWRLKDVKDEFIAPTNFNNQNVLKDLISKVQPKTIFDCIAYGAYSFEGKSNLIYQTNFQSLVSFVEILSSYNIDAYIHAGSSSEYGTNSAAPKEDSICKPNSHYAVSKYAASNYLNFVGKNKSFPCINLRLYSVYGPLEDTSRLIPNLIHQALKDKLPPFVDPKTSRDFIYIDDVINAFITSAIKINPEIYGENFNIGTGIKTTIAELADITRKEFKIKAKPSFNSMSERKWDLSDWYANTKKAKDKLDWTAKTNLVEGLQLTKNWVKTLKNSDFLISTKKNYSSKKKSVSAIIACYKDVEAIPIMHKRLTNVFKTLKIEYEIIFVNDCSPDNSEEVIKNLSKNDSHIIGISHSRNFGSQMAFRSGMEISTKDSVVLLDGDLQDPPELIIDFYKKWNEGNDVVYGRRIKRDMSLFVGLLYKAFYRIFAFFSYIKIPLDAGDFSLMDRKVVLWLLNCPEGDLFIRGIRAYVGFKQVGVDYVRPERMFGVSTNNIFKNIEWAKKAIFSFSNAPLTLLTSVGFFLFFISLVLSILVLILRIFYQDLVPKGLTTILLSVLFFGSLNILGIGLLGEYISKIMTEVKKRPRLIRSSTIRDGIISQAMIDVKNKE